ncbi:MAG TPA: hypothetical protein DEP61_07100 [Lachnospiraceae bacterium]|nr:hypothetical protein [Lachnospiraceae bacterium]
MKIWKLVSGIFTLVLSAFVLFQSSMAGLSNALEDNGESSGSAGLLVAILMIAGGIVSIVVRNSSKKGGNIALLIIFGIAALMGFTMAGSYTDLKVWAAWCLICAVLALICLFTGKKSNSGSTGDSSSQQ